MEHITNEALAVAIAGLRKEMDLRAKAAEDAIAVATKTMDARLEGMNEFREQLNKQTQTFYTRTEADLKHEHFTGKIDDLSKRVNAAELLKAEITGKVTTLAVVVTLYTTVLVAVTGAILHYALGK
jgi:hypothetical protein